MRTLTVTVIKLPELVLNTGVLIQARGTAGHQLLSSHTGPPQLTTEHDDIIYALLNQQFELVCSCPLYNVSIAWYHDNIPFPTSTMPPGPLPVVYNNTLVFPPLRAQDSGWYTCAVSNEFGRDEIDFLVVVVGKSNGLQSLRVDEKAYTIQKLVMMRLEIIGGR